MEIVISLLTMGRGKVCMWLSENSTIVGVSYSFTLNSVLKYKKILNLRICEGY